MSDGKRDGLYFVKGIYFEAKPLVDKYSIGGNIGNPHGFGNTYHSYLVYRDGFGNAEVIRGGPNGDIVDDIEKMNTEKSVSNIINNAKNFWELKIEAGVDISNTKDKYDEENPIGKRIVTRLNIEDKDIEQVWRKAVETAKSIDSRIDYELNPKFGSFTSEQIVLSENAQVCHSVTGTVLKSMGLNIDDVLKQANMTKVSVNGIETNLLDIKNLDIGTIDTIKEDAGISVDWNDLINFRDELLVKYGLKDVDFEKYISKEEHKELDFKDSFLANKLNPSEVEAKLEDIKNQLQNYLEKISNKETEPKIQLTESEIKDEVYKKVREYVHENGITSFQDIGQFMEKVREELKNGTIKIENKEQNLKEENQRNTTEKLQEESYSSQVYRR